MLNIVKITLSLWDVAGQERFDLFKTDFFNGCAAVGLVFDLARPETFERINEYFSEIRQSSGNIPIILVGNKSDLKSEVGETVNRREITEVVNQSNLFEYVETSAKDGTNVDELFNRLSVCALMDLRPRRGEIVNDNHFRFKVLLVGAAAVGKSTLISAFARKEFKADYKLTVGLDFMTQNFDIPEEELPEEILEIINNAIKVSKQKPQEYPPQVEPESVAEHITQSSSLINPDITKTPKVLTNNYIYLMIGILGIILLITFLIHFLPLLL